MALGGNRKREGASPAPTENEGRVGEGFTPSRAAGIPGDTPIDRLRALIAHLRGPDGCAWDREQTIESVRPNLLEEAHEVAAAMDGGDWDELKEELGDLLFQVGFLAQMAEEQERFDLDQVTDAVVNKMIARHPHVFGDEVAETATDVRRNWERRKRDAKETGSALDGVPSTLPALTGALRLSQKAAALGFDWPDTDGVVDKVAEEARELAEAENDRDLADEFGDVLFSLVNLARHLKLDPEGALAAANAKFRQRFGELETVVAERGQKVGDLSLEELEEVWQEVKGG